MSKEEYYNKIKRFVYRKFEELEVTERNDGDDIYLHYKNEEYAQIVIEKKPGVIYYDFKFRDKILNIIRLEETDFKILLKRWAEETFQMKVIKTLRHSIHYHAKLKIPLK